MIGVEQYIVEQYIVEQYIVEQLQNKILQYVS